MNDAPDQIDEQMIRDIFVAIILNITEAGFGDERLGGFAGFGIAGFVDGNDAELVFHILDQVVDSAVAVKHFGRLLPHRTAKTQSISLVTNLN